MTGEEVIIISETFYREVGEWCKILKGECAIHRKPEKARKECEDGEASRLDAASKGIPADWMLTKPEIEAEYRRVKSLFALRDATRG